MSFELGPDDRHALRIDRAEHATFDFRSAVDVFDLAYDAIIYAQQYRAYEEEFRASNVGRFAARVLDAQLG